MDGIVIEEEEEVQIYKRTGSPYFWGRFRLKGKQYRKSLDTTSEVVAQKRVKAWRDEVVAKGGKKSTSGGEHTFDDLSDSFVNKHLPTLDPKSAERYIDSMIHLAKSFSGLKLSQITKREMSEFETRRRKEKHHGGKPVSPSTIRRDFRCLGSMFTHAITEEWIDASPVPAYMLIKKRHRPLKQGAPKTRYLSHAEEKVLLAAASDNEMLQSAIILSIDTGLRKSALLFLMWTEVDLERRELVIPKERMKADKEHRVPLLDRSYELLVKMKAESRSPYVFWHLDRKTKEPVPYTDMRPQFERAVKKARMAKVSWHDLRRTCGCRLLQDYKMDIMRVSKWLAHASVDITIKSYAFLDIEHLHDAIKKKA